jgi:hypothetical protein
MRCELALIVIAAAATAAHADDEVVGISVSGAGRFTGRVTTADGKPLAGIEVHVTSRVGGERVVTTGRDGGYALELTAAPGESSLVFVRGHREARLEGVTAKSATRAGDEVIEVHETLPPTTPAEPISDPLEIPDYSDAAADEDVWARAWVLLEVDVTGTVRHVKFIKRAGYDLDPIALRRAFELRFHPARDKARHPIGTLVVWSFEWPSRSWLREIDAMDTKLPPQIALAPCRKAGEHRSGYRDCAGPDMARTSLEAWIAPRHRR